MFRLQFCALALLTAIGTAPPTQADPASPDNGLSATVQQQDNKMNGRGLSRRSAHALGVSKTPPPCPVFCVPRRVTDPALASVGERDVLTIVAAKAATGSQLRIASRRVASAGAVKVPSAATLSQPSETMVTRTDFRPALDPVLTDQTTTTSPE